MSAGETLDLVPLWVVFLATVASSVLSFEGGFRLGRYRHGRSAQEDKPPVGEMVGATLGLLAFMLAFTFGLSASRYDLKRGLVLDETNALGTTYLRAGLLPEPQRTEVRDLLRAYVDVRLGDVPPAEQQRAIARLEELQGRLWARAVAVGEQCPNSLVVELFIESLNKVIELHAKRVTLDLQNRIPGIIWAVLYFVAILGMAVLGYHSGLAAPRRSLAILPLILTFSAVMWLIADLDRPREGYLLVSQQAMMDLRESWRAPAPRRPERRGRNRQRPIGPGLARYASPGAVHRAP
ncbi:MAG: hypothetical protein JO252_23150 [Planctomycetaceae bacterium]|nr:hypothetical protein [Planctomycetaceae bacterium]